MNDCAKIGTYAQAEIDRKADVVIDLARRIWETPEIAYREFSACAWTAQLLEQEGFQVERNYAGLPTALRASWGSGHPVIGFLGEYDALPGLSQKLSATQEAAVPGGPGHGCGHNLLCGAHVSAAIGVKKELEQRGLEGTVVFYGCPGEEAITGKAFMARGGAFRELDAAMAWHSSTNPRVIMGGTTAMDNVKFHFKGTTSHAGAAPHNGRSALDAVELMNVGANYLREHLTDDVRMHYIITDGGSAPNIVPGTASSWYYIRALSREAVLDTYRRLVKVAEGAAHMTETQVEVEYLGGCYNLLCSNTLAEIALDVMLHDVSPSPWTDEDAAFAKQLNAVSPNYQKLLNAGAVTEDTQLNSSLGRISYEQDYSSTDVGDVSHIVPTICVTTTTLNIGATGHSWQVAACAGSNIGMLGMLRGGKVMAVTAMRLYTEPSLLEKAKKEFSSQMHNRTYQCPIPPEMPIPT